VSNLTHQLELPILRLPGRVMLPQAIRLLRVAAPQVSEIATALRGSRLLAVALEHADAFHSVRRPSEEPVCVCRVIAVRRLSAGAIRLLIRGENRGVWFSTTHQHAAISPNSRKPIEICDDEYLEPPTVHREHRCEELRQLFEKCIPEACSFPPIRMLLEQAKLGPLCDLIADCIGLGAEEGLQLLSAANVEVRSDMLLDALRSKARQALNSYSLLVSPSAN
jgi:ATP-dependent Lon protease